MIVIKKIVLNKLIKGNCSKKCTMPLFHVFFKNYTNALFESDSFFTFYKGIESLSQTLII